MGKSEQTTDHEKIRKWAEKEKGVPAKVKSTDSGKGGGLLRISFQGSKQSDSDNLEEISWDEFFEIFEDNKLALVYEPNSKDKSRFNKLVSRDS